MGIVSDNYNDLQTTARYEAMKRGVPLADAEDVAQDTIVRMYEIELEGKLDKEEMFGLCKMVASRRAQNLAEKDRRRREIEREHGKEINAGLSRKSAELLAADPFEILAYEEMTDRLDELSPLLHTTVQAFLVEGLSVSTIAEQFGTTPNVIYQRLHQAKKVIAGDNDVR